MVDQQKVIRQFGDQWVRYDHSAGYFESVELLKDFVAPYDLSRIAGQTIVDLGAGTGRFSFALLEFGPARVLAVEPSHASNVIRDRIAATGESRIEVIEMPGDALKFRNEIDTAFSIGVLHHIPDPAPAVARVYDALKPGGEFVAWLYGKEGNALYLAIVQPLRWVTQRTPHGLLDIVAGALTLPLTLYIVLCRFLPLPMRDYMTGVLAKLSWKARKVVIFDQLNPSYAKYYTEAEARALMEQANFEVSCYHRRGFSWVVIGRKPHSPHRR
jgi:SAM-dependent methyltransferase